MKLKQHPFIAFALTSAICSSIPPVIRAQDASSHRLTAMDEFQIQLVFGGLAPFSRRNIVCRVILVFGFSRSPLGKN